MTAQREQQPRSVDQFSDGARKLLIRSENEARRFNHTYIGTEHLLLGIATGNLDPANQVLLNLGVDLRSVRSSLEFIVGRGNQPVEGPIGLTSRSKKVLELALESLVDKAGEVTTLHILRSLIREGEGIACGVLESLGVHMEQVLEEARKIQAIQEEAKAQQEPTPEEKTLDKLRRVLEDPSISPGKKSYLMDAVDRALSTIKQEEPN